MSQDLYAQTVAVLTAELCGYKITHAMNVRCEKSTCESEGPKTCNIHHLAEWQKQKKGYSKPVREFTEVV